MTLTDDFADEMQQTVMIQSFVRNDGYKDIYAEGANYDCIISKAVKNITKTDGTAAVSNMQIYLDGTVAVTARDKITVGGVSPKILKVAPDYDIEKPEEVYGVTIYT